MGRPALPLSQRIRAALESSGRPLTRTEINGWYIGNHPASAVQAELDRMVAAGELADAGLEPEQPREPRPENCPRRLYGLPTHGRKES